MKLCDKGDSARAKHDHARAKRYFQKAFEQESCEPTTHR